MLVAGCGGDGFDCGCDGCGGDEETPEGSGEPVVIVKVVELTTRVRVPKSKPAGGVGDKEC